MIEVALEPSKETVTKLRWSAYVEEDNAPFELYIPKWRVPEPWPGRIRVGIAAYKGKPSAFKESPFSEGRPEDPIRVLVRRVSDLVHSVRYAPLGEPESWQIGEPYIPYSLIPGGADWLVIEVAWDLRSRGQFGGVPTYREDPLPDS
ncbi:MAG: hypothetical protein GXY76_14580 [Chloroflexi bacterium]|nr:hypothetical protein [Chloroflexota bacterium]